ncbi:unnamed protein product [marine sediment metagenome]|uniref:Uncharacterized protein n=1 Tax=marine sediment metagenome TaxID=412755 RepID=X1NQ89_9ZZZZ
MGGTGVIEVTSTLLPLEDIEFDPSKLGSGFTESKGYLLAIAIGLGLREK